MRRLPRRLRHGEEASLVEHLDELRARLILSLAALVVGFAVAFAFHERIVHWLNLALPEDRRHPLTLGVAEPFMTSVTLSLYAGFLLALPVVLWQVWSFLAPAMEEGSQRRVVRFVVVASALLVGGIAFGYFVALPNAVHFLTNFDDELYNVQIRARDYYTFASRVLLAVGLVFELPIFVLALVRLGILSTRQLRRNRRTGYFVVAVLAVLLPGVDPVTTLMEMVPLLVLFELSIWAAVLAERGSERERLEAAASIREP